MRLTAYSDYSLRVLMFLALKKDKSTINEISESYAISKEHLRKVVHSLAKENYIKAIRGRSGGLVLSSDPAQINIGAVIRKTEADLTIVECFNPETNQCILHSDCKLQHILSEALHAFLNVLDQYTLEDLIVSKNPLRKSLGL